jgi:zinc/manganese transport system substrate-binding protein
MSRSVLVWCLGWLMFSPVALAIDVVCTLPWLGDLTQRIAPNATIDVLSRGTEDPHFLSPTPALMARVRKADLYVQNGLSLELWSERLLDGAGNPGIRPGQPGYVLASLGMAVLDVPTNVTRAAGDVHPAGNPHVWLDPLNAAVAVDNILAGLQRVDPGNAAVYADNAAAFKTQLYEKLFGADLVSFIGARSLVKLARAKKLVGFLESKGLQDRLGGWIAQVPAGQKIVFYHPSWVYFIDRFGLEQVGVIENRPGVAPSASHKAHVAAVMKQTGCELIGITAYYNDRVAQVLARETGARLAHLPGDVGGTPAATDYFSLMDKLVFEVSH